MILKLTRSFTKVNFYYGWLKINVLFFFERFGLFLNILQYKNHGQNKKIIY